MKCWTISWLRPSKSRRASYCPPACRTYSFSTFTHGSLRRSALNSSRSLVSSFSLLKCCLRTASHSSGDTIWCSCSPPLASASGQRWLRRSGHEVSSRQAASAHPSRSRRRTSGPGGKACGTHRTSPRVSRRPRDGRRSGFPRCRPSIPMRRSGTTGIDRGSTGRVDRRCRTTGTSAADRQPG